MAFICLRYAFILLFCTGCCLHGIKRINKNRGLLENHDKENPWSFPGPTWYKLKRSKCAQEWQALQLFPPIAHHFLAHCFSAASTILHLQPWPPRAAPPYLDKKGNRLDSYWTLWHSTFRGRFQEPLSLSCKTNTSFRSDSPRTRNGTRCTTLTAPRMLANPVIVLEESHVLTVPNFVNKSDMYRARNFQLQLLISTFWISVVQVATSCTML